MKLEFDDEVKSLTNCTINLIKTMQTNPIGASFLFRCLFLLVVGIGMGVGGIILYRTF